MFFKKKEENAYLIVGLGNPGKDYEQTRHNCGFWAIDELAKRHNTRVARNKHHGLMGECRAGGAKLYLLKPMTYMNLSGAAVASAANFYKIPPEHIVVILDDVALAPGAIRIRERGSAGGHNGLKSIIGAVKSENFPRVRIGIGDKPNAQYPMADWVTGRPSKADMASITARLGDVCDAVELIAAGKLAEAQSRFN